MFTFVCAEDRLSDFDIEVFTENPEENASATGALCYHHTGAMGNKATLHCNNGPLFGRYIRLTNQVIQSIHICEFEVY